MCISDRRVGGPGLGRACRPEGPPRPGDAGEQQAAGQRQPRPGQEGPDQDDAPGGHGGVVLVGAFLPGAGLALAGCLLLAGVAGPWWALRAARTAEARSADAPVSYTHLTLPTILRV